MPSEVKIAYTQRLLIERASNYEALHQTTEDPVGEITDRQQFENQAQYARDMSRQSLSEAADYSTETVAKRASDIQLQAMGVSNRRREAINATSGALDELGFTSVEDRREILQMANASGSANEGRAQENTELLRTNAALRFVTSAVREPEQAFPEHTSDDIANDLINKVRELKDAVTAEVQDRSVALRQRTEIGDPINWNDYSEAYSARAQEIEATFENFTEDERLREVLTSTQGADNHVEAGPADAIAQHRAVAPDATRNGGFDAGLDLRDQDRGHAVD